MIENWHFEYSYDLVEIYTGDTFSETFISELLKEEEEGTYLCLSDDDAVETLRMIGNKDNYFFEGYLKGFGHFVLAKNIAITKEIGISGIHVSMKTMTFPDNEIFTAQEIIEILTYFHNNKAIRPDLNLLNKRYLF